MFCFDSHRHIPGRRHLAFDRSAGCPAWGLPDLARPGAHSPRVGFTLVELLVVIAIIGILTALLLTAINAARQAARTSQCQSNVRQMALGLTAYLSAKKYFPAQSVMEGGSWSSSTYNGGATTQTWTIELLPFIEEKPLWDRYTGIKRSLGSNNFVDLQDQKYLPVVHRVVPFYICPDDLSSYKVMADGYADQPDPISKNYNKGPTGVQFPAVSAPAFPLGGHGQWALGSYKCNMGFFSVPLNGKTGLTWEDPSADDVAAQSNYDNPVYITWRGPIHVVYAPAGSRRMHYEGDKDIKDGFSKSLLLGELSSQRSTNQSGVVNTYTFNGNTRTYYFSEDEPLWAFAGQYGNKGQIADFPRTYLSPLKDDCDNAQVDPILGSVGASTPCRKRFASQHRGGIINFAFCDGKVAGISPDVDLKIIGAAATIAGTTGTGAAINILPERVALPYNN